MVSALRVTTRVPAAARGAGNSPDNGTFAVCTEPSLRSGRRGRSSGVGDAHVGRIAFGGSRRAREAFAKDADAGPALNGEEDERQPGQDTGVVLAASDGGNGGRLREQVERQRAEETRCQQRVQPRQ